MDQVRIQDHSSLDKGGAFCASLLFHVLLLLVLASSSGFDIRVGRQSRFDVIFWVSPSSVAPQGRPLLPLQADASRAAPAGAGGVKGVAAVDATAKKPAPPAAASPSRPAPRKLPAVTPASPPPATARMETPADATLILPPAARPAAAHAAPKEQVVEAAAKETVHRPEPERSRPSALSMPVRLGAFLGERLSGANEAAASKRTSAAVAASRSSSEAVPAAAGKMPATAEENEESPRGVARAVTGGAVPRPDRFAPARNERPAAEKEPEPRGVITGSLQGDLKMIISGGNGIRLLVAFREYPKSRRNRPLTRVEARREQRIQPLMAKTDEDIREAVVETARDGIYIFIAEPEHEERVEARFTLKLFERGGKERIAEIGTRSVAGKAVLARVLMRDGVLWDDDSAFTGSLEDSESTTKFNANTGLYWKEYH